MNCQCPQCKIDCIHCEGWARKLLCAVGAIAGATGGAAGAEVGAMAGIFAGPLGMGIGMLAGTITGALVGAAMGASTGATLGQIIDENIFNHFVCPNCYMEVSTHILRSPQFDNHET